MLDFEAGSQNSLPFINREEIPMLFLLYKQKKKTGDQNTKEKYKQLKHHTQKITRQSHWKYIENIVTPKEEEPHPGMKKFWIYIKQAFSDFFEFLYLSMVCCL
jgi:hypothetical protein